MPERATDHAGLEVLPLDDCLRLLASVPVGRVGFHADGEVMVLPVNHAVDGQDVVLRTARGSKLSAIQGQSVIAFEADAYDPRTQSGWSVLVNGRAEMVDEDCEIQRLASLGLHPWASAVDRPFWIRIRPAAVSGRQLPVTANAMNPPWTHWPPTLKPPRRASTLKCNRECRTEPDGPPERDRAPAPF